MVLPWWCALLAAVLLAGAITLLALWCQPNALRAVLQVFRGQELLIVLNALPVGLLLLALACLLRNVFYGAAVVNLAVGALSIANCIKIEVRDEPVFPRDFALLKEVGSAMGGGALYGGAGVGGNHHQDPARAGAGTAGLAGAAAGLRGFHGGAGGGDPDGVCLQRSL